MCVVCEGRDAEFVADFGCAGNDSYFPVDDALCEEWDVVAEGPDVGVGVEGLAVLVLGGFGQGAFGRDSWGRGDKVVGD